MRGSSSRLTSTPSCFTYSIWPWELATLSLWWSSWAIVFIWSPRAERAADRLYLSLINYDEEESLSPVIYKKLFFLREIGSVYSISFFCFISVLGLIWSLCRDYLALPSTLFAFWFLGVFSFKIAAFYLLWFWVHLDDLQLLMNSAALFSSEELASLEFKWGIWFCLIQDFGFITS